MEAKLLILADVRLYCLIGSGFISSLKGDVVDVEDIEVERANVYFFFGRQRYYVDRAKVKVFIKREDTCLIQ